MKLLVVFFTTLFFLSSDLTSVRKQYLSAPDSSEVAEEFFKAVKDVKDDSSDNTLVAYKAAAYTLMAKHEKALLKKKDLFTQGAKLLEAVIKRDPSNYEARLLRLSIQENAQKPA